MVRFIKKIRNFQFKGILMILGCFILIAAALFAERSGVQYQEKKRQISYIDKDKIITEKEAADSLKKTCLVLRDSSQKESEQAWIEFQRIFMDMRVGTDVIDIQKDTIPDLDAYETVVLLLSDLDPLKEKVLDICEWVEDGGSAMFALTLQKNTYVSLIEQKLGIISSGYENTEVDSIYFDKDFLIGGGQAYTIMDPYDSAWEVELAESARVYARVGDQNGTPVIWEEDYGKGRFVVDNFGLYEKAVRGFYAASYSLLTDAGGYTVINGSVFYLDDFPSPVPGGDGTYVRRDYNTNIADFYSNIWWPDMMSLAAEHGVRYTGVMIENYEDETDGEIVKQTDTQRFQYFGNMILHQLKSAGFDWKEMRDIFVTHKHIDHLLGIIWMMRMILQNMNRGTYDGEATIYGHEEVIAILEKIAGEVLSEKETKNLGKRLHMVVVEDGEEREIIGKPVTFFDIHSTKAKQFGFSMELEPGKKLTCCGDEPYNEAEKVYAQNSQWLLHEAFCLFGEADQFKPYEKHHSTVKDACELGERLNVENLILYHTEDKNILKRQEMYLAEGRKFYHGNLYVPEDLDVIEL